MLFCKNRNGIPVKVGKAFRGLCFGIGERKPKKINRKKEDNYEKNQGKPLSKFILINTLAKISAS